ncbi:MAG: TadE/TadG family type IV pilus assembly protein [Alphaproteobacteria bacterium]
MRNRFLAALKKLRRDSEGAAAVEFALVSMGFLTMLVFIYVAGLYFITYNCLQYATEDAARYASLHEDTDENEVRTMVEETFALIPIDPDELDVVVVETSSNGVNFKEVQATYRLELDFLPFIPASATDVTFTSTSKMAIY